MNKNTLKAINKRLAAGETDFRIGDSTYRVNPSGAVVKYSDLLPCVPHLIGMVEAGKLNEERLI